MNMISGSINRNISSRTREESESILQSPEKNTNHSKHVWQRMTTIVQELQAMAYEG